LSSVMCTMLVQLARNSEALSRARQELGEAGLLREGGGSFSDAELTYETLKKLPFINDIVKEALRVIPPVGGGFRKVLKTFALEVSEVSQLIIRVRVLDPPFFLCTTTPSRPVGAL